MCYLLEIDEFRILLDCGWDTDFDEARLGPLKECVLAAPAAPSPPPDTPPLEAGCCTRSTPCCSHTTISNTWAHFRTP
jgi:hypothetical protein